MGQLMSRGATLELRSCSPKRVVDWLPHPFGVVRRDFLLDATRPLPFVEHLLFRKSVVSGANRTRGFNLRL